VSHGYLDLVADGGAFHAVWLDSRDSSQGLRYSRSTDSGASWQAARTLKAATCECCWNRAYSPGSGKVQVLFRDKDPRDMAIESSADGGASWTRVSGLGGFSWRFKGCPHQGGALARSHAFVWTGAEGKEGLYHVRLAAPAEASRIAEKGAGHVDAAASGDDLLVVWDSGQGIQAARSADDGRKWKTTEALSAPGSRATHPRVVATGRGGFAAFWTETDAKGKSVLVSRRLE
jgi:hypothetical protein